MFNAVVISVLVMVVLSLLRINVLFALILAALTAGLASGMGFEESVSTMISGMGGQSQTALSYILLGIFAVMIGFSGITSVLVNNMLKVFSGNRLFLVFSLASIACFSKNIVPVHIAFIPILIPPLLVLFDKLKLDRRAVAAALTFGLKFPYITLPVGFGLIFQGIILEEMVTNGIEITLKEVTTAMLFPGAAMIFGLLFALLISYRKDRVSKPVGDVKVQDIDMADSITEQRDARWTLSHSFTVIAIITALVLQIVTDSLVLGALSGIIIMLDRK